MSSIIRERKELTNTEHLGDRHGARQLLYFLLFCPQNKPRSKVVITHFANEKTEAHLPKITQLVGSRAENNFLIPKPILFPLFWVARGGDREGGF